MKKELQLVAESAVDKVILQALGAHCDKKDILCIAEATNGKSWEFRLRNQLWCPQSLKITLGDADELPEDAVDTYDCREVGVEGWIELAGEMENLDGGYGARPYSIRLADMMSRQRARAFLTELARLLLKGDALATFNQALLAAGGDPNADSRGKC